MLDPCLLWMPTPLLLLLVPTASSQQHDNSNETNAQPIQMAGKIKNFIFFGCYVCNSQHHINSTADEDNGGTEEKRKQLKVRSTWVCDCEGWTFRFFFIIAVREAHFSIYLFFYLQHFWLTIFSQPSCMVLAMLRTRFIPNTKKKQSARTISLLSNHNFCFRFE